ncbi:MULTISPECIES: dihydrofolate reductase family protein [unclassified Nesterenkonia]|uniref:dihydrofolate reductase family protein n=1 Tax=unclassified Nesterenkonia TaxID=2629769 RepID=UPI000873036A|nr:MULTISPECIES: dihydrofolate reductase [unclassified Nesterenkonia]MDS2174145.1 dihydrofolate reductase [Nesterenkonia sp. CL21]OSM43607.1 dihydrofolate reductase [Nesterenkonia sp. PF2B19]
MATTYLHNVVTLDGFIAKEDDDVGAMHDWYFSGDHPLQDDESHADVHGGAPFRVSAASAEYVRGMWGRQTVGVIGRHLFDITNGWEGHAPASDHVVVVSHRPKPDGWHPEAPFHFVGSVQDGVALAQELAGEGEIGIASGNMGGQALELGLVDYVAMDLVPVIFGRGKPFFGSFSDGPLLLEDPDVVIAGEGVLHLRYPVRGRAQAARG